MLLHLFPVDYKFSFEASAFGSAPSYWILITDRYYHQNEHLFQGLKVITYHAHSTQKHVSRPPFVLLFIFLEADELSLLIVEEKHFFNRLIKDWFDMSF